MIRSLNLFRWDIVLRLIFSVTIALMILEMSFYNDIGIGGVFTPQALNTEQPVGLLSSLNGVEAKRKAKLSLSNSILLPAGYEFDNQAVRNHLKGTSSLNWPINQVKKENVINVPPFLTNKFAPHEPFPLFHSGKSAEVHQCDTELNITVDSLLISQKEAIPADFRLFLEKVVEEHDVSRDPYYMDISPLFLKHLRVLLKKDMLHTFWYRFSGSSVWLKDHNVHLVVSRFMFDSTRTKNHGKLSVAWGQIFDKNWNELNDVRLVFPTNDIGESDPEQFKVKDQTFLSYRFPRIIPIPFHHDYGKTKKLYFGPEDPRTMLVRNKNGYDEPIIVFNADHIKGIINDKGKKEKKRFRSMFMSFLFQRQVGKFAVDDESNPDSDNIIYTKTTELVILGVPRPLKAKNWTPMVSHNERIVTGGYDEHILFVTRFENLSILKCDIVNTPGTCLPIYSTEGSVGALRGGTQFVNVNLLLQEQTRLPLFQLLPPGREVFLSVARAHLSECGCGHKFYRPNLVVIIKDQATYSLFEEGKLQEVTQYFFKVSHVSSFLSLNVPVEPWFLDQPNSFCTEVNAIIPNGISSWKIGSLEQIDGRWIATDEMALAFSVSDNSVDLLNIRGLLNLILNTPDKTLFLDPALLGTESSALLGLPALDLGGRLTTELGGYSNTNIECAIEKSMDFCRAYSEEQKEIEKERLEVDTGEAKSEFNKKLKDFEDALSNAPADEWGMKS